MPIILISYLVNDNLVAIHPKDKNDIESLIVEKIVPSLSPNDSQLMLTHGKSVFYIKKTNNHLVICIANEDMRQAICWKCINEICEFSFSDHVTNKYLKSIMAKYNDPKSNNIEVLKEEIDAVKGIMLNNIESIIERGEKLEDLVIKTNDISIEANTFRQIAKKVKNSMCLRMIFLIVILIFIILGIVIVAIFVGCGFPTFERCIYQKN